MKLIVGLGNPGKKYENTRHNLGFMLLDELARQEGFSFADSTKFQGIFAQTPHPEQKKIFYLKPQTYMNLSGESVAPLATFYKIAPEDILVIHDDLDLPLGTARLARSGSAGGHNGIKSIISCLGTKDFHRLKLGIGRPKHVKQEVVDHVLERFSKEDKLTVDEVIAHCLKLVPNYITNGIDKAMNGFN